MRCANIAKVTIRVRFTGAARRRQRLMVREHEIEAVQQVTLYIDNALPSTSCAIPRSWLSWKR